MLRKGIAVLLCLCICMMCFVQVVPAQSESASTGADAPDLPAKDDATIIAKDAEEFTPVDGSVLLPAGESSDYGKPVMQVERQNGFSVSFDVPKDGNYMLQVDYYIRGASNLDFLLSVSVNGEEPDGKNILNSMWKDRGERYEVDTYGNELLPGTERVYQWQEKYITDMYTNANEIYALKKGTNTFDFAFHQGEALIGQIRLVEEYAYPSYEEYISSLPDNAEMGNDPQIIEAERYEYKSASYIRGSKVKNPSIFPYDAKHLTVSMLEGVSWATPGDYVTYEFTVTDPGIYYLSLKMRQSEKKNFPVYKTIYVDDEILCEELRDYPFPDTGTKNENHYLTNGDEKIPFYFEAGTHTIKLESSATGLASIYDNLYTVVREMNALALEVKMIRGNQQDLYRDWDIESFIPDIRDILGSLADRIEAEYNNLCALIGSDEVSFASELRMAVEDIRNMLEKRGGLDRFVSNSDDFALGSGSLAQGITGVIDEMLQQQMELDRIYITTEDEELPAPNAGFFRNLWENLVQLYYSFFYSDEPATLQEQKLNVWVVRASPIVDVLNELTARSFTGENGIEVHLTTLLDEGRLVTALAAGDTPDLIVGGSAGRSYDMAVRGALKNLRDFPDFNDVVEANGYAPEMLIPYTHDNGCYALPELMNIPLAFYRTDILERLNLPLPRTWDEVIDILPVLYENDMNISTPLATAATMKPLSATMPILQQYGATLYNEDGSMVNFLQPEFSNAFIKLTDLYGKYSVAHTVGNFYSSFREGKTPIGIDGIGTYLALKRASSELEGNWTVLPSIGVRAEDGTIINGQVSAFTGVYIFNDSTRQEDAWTYAKWYMSEEIQTEYAHNLMLSLGNDVLWVSANKYALLNNSLFDQELLEVIEMQIQNIQDVPMHPAYPLVERALSDAWTNTVINGESALVALNRANINANRDMAKKLKEFGYMDANGDMIKPYNVASVDQILSWKEESGK